MIRISSKSKQTITRLLVPPTAQTSIDDAAPRGLTIQKLIHHKRFARHRERATVAVTSTGHLLCISNLINLGFDVCG